MSIFDVVTISDQVYTIPLLENSTDQWNIDDIAKKKNEEFGFRSIIGDYICGDNSRSGGVKRMMMIMNPTLRIQSTRKWSPNG